MKIRNKKKVEIESKTYWVNELTIKDVFTFHFNFDKSLTAGILPKLIDNRELLESVTDCPWEILISLPFSKLMKFQKIFMEVNKALFLQKKQDDLNTPTSSDFIGNLFFLYCNLIEAGHSEILNYGYSFFIRAINNSERIKSSQTAEMAVAFRMSQTTDNKQWKKYIKTLTR